MRAINKILAVVSDVGVVIDLVDGLIEFLLDRLAVDVRIGIVGRVDGFFLECPQYFNRRLYGTLRGAHHRIAIDRIFVILVKRTHLNTHTL